MEVNTAAQDDNILHVDESETNFFLSVALHHQQKTGKFCDVIFEVSNQTFKAHRCVLATHSDYFETKLHSEPCSDYLTIVVFCRNTEAFQECLDYLYTGKIKITKTNCIYLMKLSKDFSLSRLQEHCCSYVTRNLNISRACHQLLLADGDEFPNLNATISNFIKINSITLLADGSFNKFQLNSFKIFMKNLQTSEAILPLYFLSKWIGFEFRKRYKYLPELVPMLDWKVLNNEIVITHVLKDNNFSNKAICLFYFLKHIKRIGKVLGEYSSWLEELEALNPQLADETVDDSDLYMTVEEHPSENDNLESSFVNKNLVLETSEVENNQTKKPEDIFDHDLQSGTKMLVENTNSETNFYHQLLPQEQEILSSKNQNGIKLNNKKVSHLLDESQKQNTKLIKRLWQHVAKMSGIIARINSVGEKCALNECEKRFPPLYHAYKQNYTLDERIKWSLKTIDCRSTSEKLSVDRRPKKGFKSQKPTRLRNILPKPDIAIVRKILPDIEVITVRENNIEESTLSLRNSFDSQSPKMNGNTQLKWEMTKNQFQSLTLPMKYTQIHTPEDMSCLRNLLLLKENNEPNTSAHHSNAIELHVV